MKNKFLLIVFVLIIGVGESFAQSFTYKNIGKTMVNVVPTFEQRSLGGKQGFILYLSKDCWIEACKQACLESLNETQIEAFKKHGLVTVYINNKGEVFFVEFQLKKSLLTSVSEKELLALYEAFRRVKFDLKKATGNPSVEEFTDKYYARVFGPIVQ